MRTLGKRVCPQGYRGFESPSLRKVVFGNARGIDNPYKIPQTRIAMRFSARAFILIFFLSLAFSFLLPFQASAQTYPYPTTSYPQSYPQPTHAIEYIPGHTTSESHIDPTLPANQHTRVQTLVIDILSALACQLGGIDPVDPKKPCVDVNPVTRKLGYNQTQFNENGQPHIGGLLGASTHLIGMMYTPTISTTQYTNYMASNFGIVKPVHAQNEQDQTGYGFTSLNPILALWTGVRNIAYFLLMLAFVVIGLGIMLRVKVDPRTVMTLQNQIPRIIIAILLVTFSYGIAGLMIDMMWISTYIGINVITSAGGTGTEGETNSLNNTKEPLSKLATESLLQTPATYVNELYKINVNNDDSGVGNLTDEISFGLGAFLEQILRGFFGVTLNDSCVGWTGVNLAACIASVFGFIASILLWLIILFVILKTLFSVWFTLLKAYTYVVFFTIGSPIFIVLGLLPGKPYGFEKWLRSMLANLAVFPLTAFLFVIGRLFIELFQGTTPDQFIPPLVFQPNLGVWGVMLAFGILLMTPTMLAQLQEALKVPGTKYGSAIGAGIASGAQLPKAGFGALWVHATRRTRLHEHDAGWLRSIAAGGGQSTAAFQNNKFAQKTGIAWLAKTVQKQRAKLYKFDSKGNPTGH